MTDEIAQLLAEAPQRVEVLSVGTVATAPPTVQARSYLADGRLVAWRLGRAVPGVSIAVDAELSGQPVPRSLRRRLQCGDPAAVWPRWTTMEVACKLLEVPALVWFTRHGFATPRGVSARVFTLGDLTVAVGARRTEVTARAAHFLHDHGGSLQSTSAERTATCPPTSW